MRMKKIQSVALLLIICLILRNTAKVNATGNVVTFDSDHIMYVNDNQFLPLILYNCAASSASCAVDCGFNTMHSYMEAAEPNYMMIFLYYASEAGLYAHMGVRNSYWPYPYLPFNHNGQVLDLSQGDTDTKRHFILTSAWGYDMGDSPALLAWCGNDEPETPQFGIDANGWGDGADYLRVCDSNRHPVSTTNYTTTGITNFGQYSDLILADAYPVFLDANSTAEGLNVRTIPIINAAYTRANLNESAGRHTGLGYLVEAFPCGADYVESYPMGHPTQEQVRCSTYLSICLGAKAVIQYAWNNGTYNLSNHADMQETFSHLNADLEKLAPVIMMPWYRKLTTTASENDIYSLAYRVGNGDSVYLFAVNTSETETNDQSVRYTGKRYIANSQNDVEITISSLPSHVKRMHVMGEERSLAVSSNNITDDFGKYGSHIYTSAFSTLYVIDANGYIWSSRSEGPPEWLGSVALADNPKIYWGGWSDFDANSTTIEPLGVGDIDNDGFDDFVVIRSDGTIKAFCVSKYMGTPCVKSLLELGNPKTSWGWSFSPSQHDILGCGVGDINGDGYADIVTIDQSGNITSLETNGSTIVEADSLGNAKTTWGLNFTSDVNGVHEVNPLGIGDVNRDGKGDIYVIDELGNIKVLTTDGTSLTSIVNVGNLYTSWGWLFGSIWDDFVEPIYVDDINGDGYGDICVQMSNGQCRVLSIIDGEVTDLVEMGNPIGAGYHPDTGAYKNLGVPYGWGWHESDIDVPTLVSAGNIASGTGTIIPALPANISANDILLLFLETANQAISITNQNGGTWTQVSSSPQGTGTAGGNSATRLTAFWSRYNGTQGAPTTSDSGDHQIGRIIAIRGAITSGNPWDVTGGGVETTSDTSGSIPGATSTVPKTLIVAAVAGSLPDSIGTTNFSSWTNANLTSLVECVDNTQNAGNGGCIGIVTGIKTSAGAYGNTTVTHASAAVKGMMSIAIKP